MTSYGEPESPNYALDERLHFFEASNAFLARHAPLPSSFSAIRGVDASLSDVAVTRRPQSPSRLAAAAAGGGSAAADGDTPMFTIRNRSPLIAAVAAGGASAHGSRLEPALHPPPPLELLPGGSPSSAQATDQLPDGGSSSSNGGLGGARRSPSPLPPLRSVVRALVSDNPLDALHVQPASAVIGATTALSMISAYVLQHHVLDTHDHIGVFLFGSYSLFASYFMVYYMLERYSTSFRKISQDRKFYTISNLLKAGVLVSITPFAVKNLYKIVWLDEWDSNTLRNLGCIYAIPDFVSMLIVRKMPWTTWLHHICVCIFNFFSVRNDYRQENVCRLIVVYAAFSTFAYCVNMLLASRFLGVSPHNSRVLSFVALCVYVLCCAINWVWQAHYLRKLIFSNDHWTIYLYMTLICFVMWDDIVLNKWLLQNARNTGGVMLAAASAAALVGGSGGSNDAARVEQHGALRRPGRSIRGACY